MMDAANGSPAQSEPVRLPFNIVEFLSGAAYAVAITIAVIGVVVWTIRQEGRINELQNAQIALREDRNELRTKDEVTRQILDQHLTAVNARIDALDRSGSRELQTAQATLARAAEAVDRLIERMAQVTAKIEVLETQIKTLKEVSDSRIPFMSRADTALQDQAIMKQQLVQIDKDITQLRDRIDRIVQALDQTFNQLQEHLRAGPEGHHRSGKNGQGKP